MIKNISIKKKLWISYLILFFMILVMSVLSAYFLLMVRESTQHIYEHPYIVSNTIKDFESNIFKLKNNINILVVVENDDLIDYYEESVENLENENLEFIEVLKDRYLGDMNDVILLESLFLTSMDNRDIVFNYVKDGDYDAAQSYFYSISPDHRGSIIEQIGIIEQFAENKGNEFVEAANSLLTLYTILMSIFGVMAISLTIVIALLMQKDIVPPLNDILLTIQSHKSGENKTYLDHKRGDELGFLSKNLEQMLKFIKTQNEMKELTLKLENLRSREVLRITLLSIGDGVITTDLNGKITQINSVASKLTGYSEDEALNKDLHKIFNVTDINDKNISKNPVEYVLKNKKVYFLDNGTMLQAKDGTKYHISDSAAPIRDESNQIYGVVIVFRDITSDYIKQQQIEYLSYYDKLTGLRNRNYLEGIISSIKPIDQNKVGIIIGDANGLKVTNDAFGHDYGDKLLQTIADILKDYFNPEKSIAVRWGGDEFVIVVYDTTINQLDQMVQDIIHKCKTTENDGPLKPNISLGFALYEHKDVNLFKTLIRAENMMYQNKLVENESYRSNVVSSMENSLFEKSYETEQHALRVANCTETLGKALKLKRHEINELRLLGKLHDIGKISIDDSILSKKGSLNEAEWEIIKKHPETGYRIASNIKELSHIADAILSHHEKWDGTGYPQGLSKEDIPLMSRILSVCDAYDVMTNERPYKRKFTKEEAIEELIRCKGTQFDPKIVDIFIEKIKSIKGDGCV